MSENNSTLISNIQYLKDQNKLFVQLFSAPDVTYEFLEVPIDIFEQFINAPSRGKFFNSKIKKNFKVIKTS
jgi:hypothetical protein